MQFSTSTKTVKFNVLTATTMEITVFWGVTPCSLVECYQRFGGELEDEYAEDGDSISHRDVGKFPPDYTALHPSNPIDKEV
jgi:hypothetical protein